MSQDNSTGANQGYTATAQHAVKTVVDAAVHAGTKVQDAVHTAADKAGSVAQSVSSGVKDSTALAAAAVGVPLLDGTAPSPHTSGLPRTTNADRYLYNPSEDKEEVKASYKQAQEESRQSNHKWQKGDLTLDRVEQQYDPSAPSPSPQQPTSSPATSNFGTSSSSATDSVQLMSDVRAAHVPTFGGPPVPADSDGMLRDVRQAALPTYGGPPVADQRQPGGTEFAEGNTARGLYDTGAAYKGGSGSSTGGYNNSGGAGAGYSNNGGAGADAAGFDEGTGTVSMGEATISAGSMTINMGSMGEATVKVPPNGTPNAPSELQSMSSMSSGPDVSKLTFELNPRAMLPHRLTRDDKTSQDEAVNNNGMGNTQVQGGDSAAFKNTLQSLSAVTDAAIPELKPGPTLPKPHLPHVATPHMPHVPKPHLPHVHVPKPHVPHVHLPTPHLPHVHLPKPHLPHLPHLIKGHHNKEQSQQEAQVQQQQEQGAVTTANEEAASSTEVAAEEGIGSLAGLPTDYNRTTAVIYTSKL